MKIIVGTSGRINEILKGVPNEEFMDIAIENNKAWVVLKSDVTAVTGGEVKTVEVEVIKEIIKEVIKEVDNPEHMELLEEAQEQIQTLQDALSDALNAEEAAKKEAIDLKKNLKELKTKFTNLKKKFLEED